MDVFSPTENEMFLAGDHHWRWILIENGALESQWRLRWQSAAAANHHRFIMEQPQLGPIVFPHGLISSTADALLTASSSARPLSALSWERDFSAPRIQRLFEGLGLWLRRIHDLPAPEGFGHGCEGPTFRTINAYLDAEFTAVGEEIKAIAELASQEAALQMLADLRHELSSFHPLGKSAWTLGGLDEDRLSVHPVSGQIEACMDLSNVALRPPEYDLATLNHGALFRQLPLAKRAFWKGYRAAHTRDWDRRIGYFDRLLALKSMVRTKTAPLLPVQEPSL